jgi:hypothetical protein
MPDTVRAFLFPAVAVVVILAFAVMRRRATRRAGAQHAGYRADLLARTMGLAVRDGDPGLNLMLAHTIHTQKSRNRTHVLLHGVPAGRDTTFTYDFVTNRRHNPLLGEAVYHTGFTCRLTIQGRGAFPAFEVVLRNPVRHLAPRPELPLASQRFGDPALDAHFDLRAEDSRVGTVLGPVLAAMTQMSHVHIVGSAGAVHWTADENASSVAIYHLPQVQRLLEDALTRLEPLGPASAVMSPQAGGWPGRQTPAVGPPIHPTGPSQRP